MQIRRGLQVWLGEQAREIAPDPVLAAGTMVLGSSAAPLWAGQVEHFWGRC